MCLRRGLISGIASLGFYDCLYGGDGACHLASKDQMIRHFGDVIAFTEFTVQVLPMVSPEPLPLYYAIAVEQYFLIRIAWFQLLVYSHHDHRNRLPAAIINRLLWLLLQETRG